MFVSSVTLYLVSWERNLRLAASAMSKIQERKVEVRTRPLISLLDPARYLPSFFDHPPWPTAWKSLEHSTMPCPGSHLEHLMQNKILDDCLLAHRLCTSDFFSDIHQEQSQRFKTWIWKGSTWTFWFEWFLTSHFKWRYNCHELNANCWVHHACVAWCFMSLHISFFHASPNSSAEFHVVSLISNRL